MTTSLAPLPIGPYFDVSALTDYLSKERDTCARLCTKRVLDGDIEGARYYAEKFAPLDATIDRVWAYWDSFKDSEYRWIGWDVQNGWEGPRPAPVLDPWATPAAGQGVDPAEGERFDDYAVDFSDETPEMPSRCDSEKGWAECRCGVIWHFKSHCSLPRELWIGDDCDPAAGTHDLCYIQLFEDCHCGSFDPAIEHPCIGHDRATGLPLEGPTMFWKFWEIRKGLRLA